MEAQRVLYRVRKLLHLVTLSFSLKTHSSSALGIAGIAPLLEQVMAAARLA